MDGACRWDGGGKECIRTVMAEPLKSPLGRLRARCENNIRGLVCEIRR